MIKAILFDIGGVLASDLFSEFDRYIAAKAKVELKTFKHVRKPLWHLYEHGEIDGIRFMAGIIEAFNLDFTPEELLKQSLTFIKVNHDTLDIVKELRDGGYRLGVITNNSDEWSRYEHDTLGLGRHFDCWISSSDMHICKPCKEMYDKAASDVNTAPEECLFVDNKEVNVNGAIDQGMHGILFTDAVHLRAQLTKKGLLKPKERGRRCSGRKKN